jgi:hypothetical protein
MIGVCRLGCRAAVTVAVDQHIKARNKKSTARVWHATLVSLFLVLLCMSNMTVAVGLQERGGVGTCRSELPVSWFVCLCVWP